MEFILHDKEFKIGERFVNFVLNNSDYNFKDIFNFISQINFEWFIILFKYHLTERKIFYPESNIFVTNFCHKNILNLLNETNSLSDHEILFFTTQFFIKSNFIHDFTFLALKFSCNFRPIFFYKLSLYDVSNIVKNLNLKDNIHVDFLKRLFLYIYYIK